MIRPSAASSARSGSGWTTGRSCGGSGAGNERQSRDHASLAADGNGRPAASVAPFRRSEDAARRGSAQAGQARRASAHAKTGHAKPEYSKPGHSKPGHSKPGHSKPGHAKPGHSKPGYSKPGHSKPGQPKYRSSRMAGGIPSVRRVHPSSRGRATRRKTAISDKTVISRKTAIEETLHRPRCSPRPPYRTSLSRPMKTACASTAFSRRGFRA